MPKFALLLNHEPARYTDLASDDYMDIMKDYFAWVQARMSEGVYQGGHKLKTDQGKMLSSRSGSLEVHDIASAEVAEVLGGVMIIEAATLAAAVELVRDHPHFIHNHNMTILPVDPTTED